MAVPWQNSEDVWKLDDQDAGGAKTALKRAKKILRAKNKKEFTCEFTMPGSVQWSSGRTFLLDETWGKFAGKYQIDEAIHSMSSGSGYTTRIIAHRVLKGY
jgi:hypothetical protein